MKWGLKGRISELIGRSSDQFLPTLNIPTLKVRYFGVLKIPLIFAVSPKVIKLNKHECQIRIPLNYVTKNHENCMYFGALSIGADLAGGLLALNIFKDESFHFLFKDVHAQFYKRCESDAYFYCNDGSLIAERAMESKKTGGRVNIPLSITVFAPDTLGSETPCARYNLTLSIKPKLYQSKK